MTNERACANTPVISRRSLLTALPVAGASLALPAAAAPASSPDMPFLIPIKGEPDLVALCYPKTKIDYGYCYMLNDGCTIIAECDRWRHGSDSGWRKIEPGQFDGRVIGRVVGVHRRSGRNNWHDFGHAYLGN